MVFSYFSLFLLSFLPLTATFAYFLTGLWTICVCVMVSDSQIVSLFFGMKGLAGDWRPHGRFLMFFRHTASKFTGTGKLWFLIGLLSLSKDSGTGAESIYWLKCVLLCFDGWPHAPFQLVSSRPFSHWPFTSQTWSQSACSISRQTGHVSTTWHTR